MNTPNKLTVTRIFIVPFYVLFLLVSEIPHHYLWAAILFAAAAYTDHLDGKLARKNNMITDFGKFADPLADKIMIISALACFVQLGLTNAVVLILIIAREFMVTSVRLVAMEKGKVVAANIWGKIKTVGQIVAIILIILMQYILELNSMGLVYLESTETAKFVVSIINIVLMWLVVLFTWVSGAVYIRDNMEFIRTTK